MLFVAPLATFFQETLLLTLPVDDPPLGNWCHWPVYEGFHPDCGFSVQMLADSSSKLATEG